MNLIDYGRILVRRGWIIVLLAVIAAGGAYFLSTRQTPIYRSIQKVLIQPARLDLSVTESSKALLSSLSEFLNSSYRAAEVIDQLKLDMTPTQLLGNVDIVAVPLSLSIEIGVDLPDADLANRVAKAWGERLVLYRDQENQKNRREDQVNALLQDDPRPTLLAPRPAINAAAGAVLGFLLGGIIVFVLEYLESSVVRRRDDLERGMELPVLAAIPEDVEG
ncbi:MAG: Wzz/FepE/Etk N-terminal domain-containing protein [Chloroflexota bacterium]